MVYRILWVDDNVEDLDGGIRLLQQRLRLHGFDLDVKYLQAINEESISQLIIDLKKNNPYDLIIVDYDLGSAIVGVAVLKRLRTIIHNTMILYSSKSVADLRQYVCDAQFDGVFCISRTELDTQLFPLIEVTLGKLASPVLMRGMIVGAVSEIDSFLISIALSILSIKNDEEKKKILSEIKDRHGIYLKTEIENLESRYGRPLNRLIRDLNLHQKKELLTFLLNEVGCHVSTSCVDALGRFLENINPVRIDLAHGSTVDRDGIPILSKKDGGQYSTQELTTLLRSIALVRESILNANNHFLQVASKHKG